MREKEAAPAAMTSTAEPIGQNLIKLISNFCFSIFVFSVLIFTVIAVTYKPPDPWLDSAPALSDLFTKVENATFHDDSSVLNTGEDLVLVAPSRSPISAPITEATIAISEKNITGTTNLTISSPSDSDSDSDSDVPRCAELNVVNCSDPRVLIAIEKFNLRIFKSIMFLEYGTPVNGSKPDECDVVWKFRNKKEKSWRRYRDFRRFKIGLDDNCVYRVVHAGRWHSGVNARRPRRTSNTTGTSSRGRRNPKAVVTVSPDNEINDTIPNIGSDTDFRKGRYLYYSRGGDYCKGMNHYLWSFLCGLGEAQYLNRTFVMDLSICLSGQYTSTGKDEEGKDFRYYFDFEHLKEVASIVEEGEFLRDWKRWDRRHKRKIPVKKVASHKITPMHLRKEKSTVLWRQFDSPEPDNYWYRVCEGRAANYINRPWHALWKSKRLMNIVSEISGRMDWDFDAVHVVRGDKAQNKALWPHLDADTSPDALVSKLLGMVKPWRNLYVATNEPFYNYFDKLRSHYKVHLLDDYKELWGNKSEWYNETLLLNDGRPVNFDGYMRVEVDTEVFYRAKTQVQTFYNLTKDCKDGVNTC